MENLAGIYLFALVFGGGFFLVSSLFGGHDQVHHIGGHDLGHLFGHHGMHHGDGDHDNPAASLLNLRNILAFIAGFGLVGTVTTQMIVSPILTLALSIPSGILAAIVSWLMLLFLISQQSTSQAEAKDYFGKEAMVSVGIPAKGLGEITTTIKGQRMAIPAKSSLEEPLPKGTRVVIIEYSRGGVVIVSNLE